MNRFRTKRRAKDDLAAGRASEDSEQSGLSFFRKGKKTQQEDVKKEFDLATALPSDNDFRTSLLMNNLSARFSMLREQDDPNTKIGKASDDSVLFHKRQSRMADFGFGSGARGLSDIAEVESIRGATFLRTTSVASDDPDLGPGDSVLARARPTEGNNLFGGRQKIYKIPATSGGGMGGRAVYEEDVALSSFQRWRQNEREKALGGQTDDSAGLDEGLGHLRSGSPPPTGYNHRRETTSTTSSASIMARNSTAATSITSQGPIAAKDGFASSAAAASTGAAPIPERNVTRTRRLYEQKEDSSEPQGSILSRFEALSRPRPFGSRTPDLSGSATPQPDSLADRFGSSRSVLAKNSAPNLRSMSPPAAGRAIGTLDVGIKVQTETKPNNNLGGLPPLSPPVSETGEQPILPILPKDVGKATAMGLFQKPSQPYDESQYVQRQLQLQQGRETPTRGEPIDKIVPQPQDHVTKPAMLGIRSSAEDARFPPTPIAEVDPTPSTTVNLPGLTIPRDVNIERPSDKDHPAFRQSALPTPLSFGGRFGDEPSPRGKPSAAANDSQQPSPEDSPTLGPASGLSGLVRQHLRTESVDSFGSPELDPVIPDFGFNLNSAVSSPPAGEARSRFTAWPSSESDWTPASPGRVSEPASPRREEEAPPTREVPPPPTAVDPPSIPLEEDDTVEFASQIADARRRVREKLTSYVESDSSRAPSPLLLPTESPGLAAPTSNPLGILKPKTSRGSLVDRSRNMITGQSKGLKLLGLGASTMSTPTQSGKQSFDEKEFPSLETMKEEVSREEPVQMNHSAPAAEIPEESGPEKEEDGGNAHPGLRAFRQARRELQRRKELETLARHQMSQTAQGPEEPLDQRNGMHPATRAPRQRTPSRERRPPPVTYKQRPPSDEHSYSSPNGARPSGERSRSGSEASAGRSSSRPRTNTITGPHDQLALPNSGRPMMRSPGLPGTDIKGSPLMPPHPYAGRGGNSPAASPHLHQSRSAANLALHTGRPGLDAHSGQPSPISPMGLPSPSPYSMGPAASPVGTPTSFGPRPRLASASQSPGLGPANGPMPGQMKRPIDKRDISDPSFVMSTSRVPTTNLPHQYPPQSGYPPHPHHAPPMAPGMGDGGRPYGGGPRSRSNSRAAGGAPPLPPINPRRRRDDSRTRAPHEEGEMAAPPRLPYAAGQGNNSDYGGASEDEGGNRPDHRRRLRKAHPDMQHPGPRPYPPGGARDNSPPFVAKGPP